MAELIYHGESIA